MTDQKYTLLQMVQRRRNELAETENPEGLNSIHVAFSGILHDALCGTENVAFTVILTADGEPFVDWAEHTEDGWLEVFAKIDIERQLAGLVRKLFGR